MQPTDTPTMGEDVNAPLRKMWALLRPQWSTLFAGEFEILAMFALCLTRGVELRLNTSVVRALDTTLANRNVADFRVGLLRGSALWVGGTWVRILYSYLQARLTWKWRRKLTDRLHKQYFAGMCYYLIGEGGGRGTDRMSDADTRITNDCKICCDQIATTFANSMFCATAGVFYTLNIWSVFGWRFASIPYLYLGGAFCCVNMLAKPVLDNFRKAGRLRGESWGLYTFAAARIGLQAESIASLKGAALEHKYLLDLWALHKHDIWEHNLNIWKFGTINNFFMTHMMSQMTGIVCIGRGILFPRFPDGVDTIEKMSLVRSDVGVAWVLYSSTMESARVMVEMIRTLQQLVSEVERVVDLQELLTRVADEKQSELSQSIQGGDAIAFDEVDIFTPAGVLLVKRLSFKIQDGESLLLVGHNGAGKSSIFRCLGGLWRIPTGTITRPSGHMIGLNNDTFYIPQKPYNVWGTLQDQMTYPDTSGGEMLTKEKLHELLIEVDLEYLVDRPGALTDEINWDEELSLGEKQRLAIARLLHHKPRFAILDECSSAISSEMERRLYRVCKDQKITYITIAHRPQLKSYHDQMLSIGDGHQGWKLEKIERDEQQIAATLAMAKASVISKEAESSILDHKHARSARYSERVASKAMPEERSTASRMLRMLKISWPSHSLAKGSAIAALIIGQTINEDLTFGNTGRMFGCLMDQNLPGMLRLSVNALLGALAQSLIWESLRYMQQEIGTEMAEKMWRNLMARYMSHDNFYVLPHQDGRIKDAELRIMDDIYGVLLHAFHNISVGVLRPVTKLLWFTWRIDRLLGHTYAGAIWVYLGLCVVILKNVMPDFRSLWRRLSKLDSKFKRVHVRVKTCAESIAFFGGGERERQTTEAAFTDLMTHEWDRHYANFKFQLVDDVFRQRIPETIQWILRFSYGINAGGTDAEMLADKGQKVFLGQQYVMQMAMSIFAELGAVMGLAESFATLAGRVQRVAEVQEVLDELEMSYPETAIGDTHPDEMYPLPRINKEVRRSHIPHTDGWGDCIELHERNVDGVYLPLAYPECGGEHIHGQIDPETRKVQRDPNAKIALVDVDVVTPRGEAMCSHLSVVVTPSDTLMITGRNASGKTSLVRVISGLWPHTTGAVTVPCPASSKRPGLKDVFVVPQRIHMFLGTLADQVTYPVTIPKRDRTPEDEARLKELLDTVGIGYLVSRWAGDDELVTNSKLGWDCVAKWEDVLSLGEQQRLSMARMFYHQPQFGLLDECTSAVSIDVEERLYKAAHQAGTSCITLSQRLSLPEFHARELRVGENTANGWTLGPVMSDGFSASHN